MATAAREPTPRASSARTKTRRALPTVHSQPLRVALALAGGGPLGAIYEIGALNALSESVEGLDLNGMHQYVGVSAGAFITAGLANGITPVQLSRMFIAGDSAKVAFDPERFLMPAYGEWLRGAGKLPGLLFDGLRAFMGSGGQRSVIDAFQRITRSVPTGLFNNAAIAQFLRQAFFAHGGSDDFRALRSRLVLVATDLDTGEAIPFGAPGFDHVPISQAIQASAALPGLFPPVEIDGRWYVDGALKKTLHASVALRDGAGLVLCINPLVPYNAALAAQRSGSGSAPLVHSGLTTVLSQTLRTLIHSRMEVGMARYAREFPEADIVLFEPDHADSDLFFTNPFSYATRQKLCEHAYQQTRQALWARREALSPVFERHGMRLRLDVLQDTQRQLLPPMAEVHRRRGSRLGRTALDLQDTLDRLQTQLGRRTATASV